MLRTLYVGYVLSTEVSFQIHLVSASRSKKEAGELMEQWLKDNDPDGINFQNGGVHTISGADYIRIDSDRP